MTSSHHHHQSAPRERKGNGKASPRQAGQILTTQSKTTCVGHGWSYMPVWCPTEYRAGYFFSRVFAHVITRVLGGCVLQEPGLLSWSSRGSSLASEHNSPVSCVLGTEDTRE